MNISNFNIIAGKHENKFTPWAERKIRKRKAKETGWIVRPATNTIYDVFDRNKNGTVNLENGTCTCGQWQLSGIPCGHVIAVSKYHKQKSLSQWVSTWFRTDVWRASYEEVIYDVGHPSEWERPENLMTVLPPIIEKRLPGRPRNNERIPSQGESPIKKRCTRCHQPGHSRSNCPNELSFETMAERATSKSRSFNTSSS